MKISACCIIKNEEKNLPLYIDGVKNLADEIIIVDTGSTDNSLKLLEELKQKYNLNLSVYYFKWINDFAAAKNFALSKAAGDWAVTLDADEYYGEEDQKKIRLILNKIDDDKSIIGLKDIFLNVDKDKNFETISKGRAIKIFRRNEDIKYEGQIHEQLKYSGKVPGHFLDSELVIIHTGYSSSVIKQKKERNDKIILKNFAVSKDNTPDNYFYLASAYLNKGDLKKAEKNIKKAIEFTKNREDYMFIGFFNIYKEIKQAQNVSKAEMKKFIEYAIEKTDRHPDFLAQKLSDLIADNPSNIEEIEKLAKEILEKANDKELTQKYLNRTDIYLPLVQNILNYVYKIKGNAK